MDIEKRIRRQGDKHIDSMINEDVVSMSDVQRLMEQTEDLFGEPKQWFDVLRIPDNDRIYIQSVLRAGEKFDSENPRIKLSTIHKAKGGEADNVALMLETSRACQTMNDPDSEVRTFYVGMTRAKHNLHLIEGRGRWSFQV